MPYCEHCKIDTVNMSSHRKSQKHKRAIGELPPKEKPPSKSREYINDYYKNNKEKWKKKTYCETCKVYVCNLKSHCDSYKHKFHKISSSPE